MKNINNIIFKIFQRRYWYSVRFIYLDNKNNRILDYYNEVGLKNKQDVLNHRTIKKIGLPLHLNKEIHKKYLCNGVLQIEIISYLGWI